EGRIVRVDWLEPKSVWIEALGAGGNQLWRVDTGAASFFSDADRSSLAEGMRVTVRGYNAKDASCAVYCRMAGRDFTLATGAKIASPTGTGICSMDQLIQNACTVAQRPGPPPVLR